MTRDVSAIFFLWKHKAIAQIDDAWNTTPRLIRIDIYSKSLNLEKAGKSSQRIDVGNRIVGNRIVICSNKGCGKCESSGVESDGTHLLFSQFSHTFDYKDNHLVIFEMFFIKDLKPTLNSLMPSVQNYFFRSIYKSLLLSCLLLYVFSLLIFKIILFFMSHILLLFSDHSIFLNYL